jgi:SAM-dependent methyltransferase
MSTPNFTYDPNRGGVFAPKFQIVPYPSPIMRRQVLYDILKNLPSFGDCNKYIEIGYGTGIFAYEFYRMGFDVYGYDSSKSAYNTAQELFNSDKQRLKLKNELHDEDKSAYDILGAYEVLEHIENDVGVLREWRELLNEKGLLLLSVPAHMKNFGLRDKWAGHFRRYEKENLHKLLTDSGFEVVRLISYGFPLPKLMNKAIEILIDKPHLKRMGQSDKAHKTSVSGVARTEEYKFKNILPYRVLVLSGKIQRLFYNTDFGIGYIVAARKSLK